jgi:large subunit ribosomal protein L19
MSNIIEQLEKEQIEAVKREVPEFGAGDTVVV